MLKTEQSGVGRTLVSDHSVNSVHDSLRIENLLMEVRALGVVLTVEEGRLVFDAPHGALTHDLLDRLRSDREGLIGLITGGYDDATEGTCPWCGRVNLLEDPGGLRCTRCSRLAWHDTPEGGLVRADFVDPNELARAARLRRLMGECADVQQSGNSPRIIRWWSALSL